MRAKLVERITLLSFCVMGYLAADVAGQSAVTQTIPLTPPAIVACNGEPVTTDGVMHVTTRTDLNPTGGVHLITHTAMVGMDGVGVTSGDKYKFHSNNEASHASNGAQSSTTHEIVYRVIHLNGATGQAMDDLFVRFKFHVTVNAKFQVTALFDETEATCQ